MIPGPVIAGVSDFVSWCFKETQTQHLWNAQKQCWGWTTPPTVAEIQGSPASSHTLPPGPRCTEASLSVWEGV